MVQNLNLFTVVILAGGMAKRLLPITETIPKALIEVNNEPFIAHQLRLFCEQNIKKVVICVGHLGEMIEDFVGDGRNFNIKVEFSSDGDKLLGTAGAIKKAIPLLEDNFFVTYGDSYLPCQYQVIQRSYQLNKKKAMMTVFQNNNRFDKSNVEIKEGKIVEYNKFKPNLRMNYIDYGLGVFHKSAFDMVPKDVPYDLSELYRILVEKREVSIHEIYERFYEIGSFEGLNELNEMLMLKNQS